ncbi:MAG: Lpp/OprI family alanine-zipper lipoprotein [Candidatus Eutrophobiaceae bacterium]
MHKTPVIRMLALVIGMLALTGCASSDMSKRIDEANRAAQQAMEQADAAYSLAHQANKTANEASYEAQQAQETANAALECCNDNAQKMDRMFENIMTK